MSEYRARVESILGLSNKPPFMQAAPGFDAFADVSILKRLCSCDRFEGLSKLFADLIVDPLTDIPAPASAKGTGRLLVLVDNVEFDETLLAQQPSKQTPLSIPANLANKISTLLPLLLRAHEGKMPAWLGWILTARQEHKSVLKDGEREDGEDSTPSHPRSVTEIVGFLLPSSQVVNFCDERAFLHHVDLATVIQRSERKNHSSVAAGSTDVSDAALARAEQCAGSFHLAEWSVSQEDDVYCERIKQVWELLEQKDDVLRMATDKVGFA
jgi:hypothetical protein